MGANYSYAENLLQAVDAAWKTQTNIFFERSETSGYEKSVFTFAEVHITAVEDMFDIDQDFHIRKIKRVPNNVEIGKLILMLKSLRVLQIPDKTSCFKPRIGETSLDTYKQDKSKHFNSLNKAIEYFHENKASIRISIFDYD